MKQAPEQQRSSRRSSPTTTHATVVARERPAPVGQRGGYGGYGAYEDVAPVHADNVVGDDEIDYADDDEDDGPILD